MEYTLVYTSKPDILVVSDTLHNTHVSVNSELEISKYIGMATMYMRPDDEKQIACYIQMKSTSLGAGMCIDSDGVYIHLYYD